MDKARLKAEMSLLSELIMHGAREVKCGGCGITLLIPTEQDGYTCDDCGFSPNPSEVMAMLSEKQLQEIRERAEQVPGSSLAKTQKDISRAFFDRATLIDEVERLRNRLAAQQQFSQEAVEEVNRLRTELEAARVERECLIDDRHEAETENVAMREIVQFVAGCDIGPYSRRLLMWQYDDADVYVTKARAILAQPEEVSRDE